MALEAARILVRIGADVSGLDKGLGDADRKVSSFGSKMGTVAAVGAAAFGVAVVGGLTAAVSAAADFEQSLANTRSATGATTEQMARMRTEALGIGKDTSKSAADAAEAMGELVKAGVSVETVVGGAARAAVRMAEATGIEVPNAANLMAKALNTFQAEGLTAEQAADSFAKAANASAISVTDMGFSLAAVGPVASAAGLTMRDFATAIGIMGNNALVGSDAGTSLKAFIAGLTPASDKAATAMKTLGFNAFDAQGQIKPFPEIIGNLQKSFAGLSDESRMKMGELLFGSDGIRAMNIFLKEGVAGWNEFGAAMSAAPSLAEQSAIRMGTLNGQIEMLKGSIETIAISLGTLFLPALTKIATAGANALNFLLEQDWSNLSGVFANISTEVSKLGDAFLAWIGPLIGSLNVELDKVSIAVLEWIGTAYVAYAEQVASWAKAFLEWIGPMIPGILEELGRVYVAITVWMVDTALPALVTALAEWGKAFIEWVVPQIPGLIAEADKLYAALGDWITGTALPGIAAALVGWAEAFAAWVVPATGDLMAALPGLHDQMIAWIGEKASVDLPYALGQWAAAFVKWHEQAIADLPGILQSIIDTIVGWVQTIGQGMMADAGNAMGGSFLDGLKESIASIPSRIAGDLQNVASVGKNIANNLIAGYKDGMEQRSPSKVMERLAEDSVQGLVNGFKRSAPEVKGALQSMLKSMTSDDVSMIAVWNEIANKWGGSFANAIEKAANVALDGRSSGGLGNSPDFTKWSPGMPRTADDMSPAEYMQTFGAIPKAAKVSAAEAAGAYQSLWKSVTDDTISHTTVLREIAQRYGEDFARSIDKQVLAQRGLSSSLTDTVLGAKNLGTTLGTTVAQGAGTASAAMMKFGSAATDAGNAAADAFTKANASFADWDKNKAAITERAMAATFAAPRGQGASGVAYYGDATSNTLNAWSTLMAKANAAGMGARADELRRGGFMNPYQAAEALAEESRTSLRRSIGMGAKALGSGGSGGGNTVTVQPGAIQFVINGNNPSEIRRVVGEVLDEHMGFDAYAAGV